MSLTWRQRYAQMVLEGFLVFFMMFALIIWLTYPSPGRPWLGLALGLLAGWFLGGLIGGVRLTLRYIVARSTRFKVLSCVFFFVPIWVAMFLAMFYAVPYGIYNAVLVRRIRRTDPRRLIAEAAPERPGAGSGRVVPVEMFLPNFLCYTLIFALLAGSVLVLILVDALNVLLGFFLILAGGFGVAIWQSRRANRKLEAIQYSLNMLCDPERFIRENEAILVTQHRPGNRNYLQLQLSTGHLYAGRPMEARACLDRVKLGDRGRGLAELKIMYYNNLVVCHLERGEFDLAEEALERLERSILALPRERSAGYMPLYTGKRYRCSLARGDAEGCAQYFTVQFDLETRLSAKVDCMTLTARACLLTGELDRAREALEYVVEHGNKLSTVHWARGVLDRMDRQERIEE